MVDAVRRGGRTPPLASAACPNEAVHHDGARHRRRRATSGRTRCAPCARPGATVVVLDSLELGRARPFSVRRSSRATSATPTLVQQVCRDHGVTAIMHFAAYKSVGESMQSPGKYWHNNVDGTAALVEAAMRAGVARHRVLLVVLGLRHAGRRARGRDGADRARRASTPSARPWSSGSCGGTASPTGCARSACATSTPRARAATRAIGEDWTFSINLIPLVMKAVLGAGAARAGVRRRLPDARRHVHPRLHPRRRPRRRPHPGARPARRRAADGPTALPSTSAPASVRRCSR